MSPTRIRLLLILLVVAAATGWALARILMGLTGRAVPVPWLAPATMWSLTIALLIWAVLCRPRLPRRTKAGELIRPAHPLPPLTAARTAALAMAASRVGALVAGFYLGVVIGAIPSVSTDAGRTTLTLAAVAAAGAAFLAAVALWLEAMCRLPQDPGDDGSRTRLRP